MRENSICTFAVCSARYKTRPGLVYHYGHSHSTSSGDPAMELSPSPAEVDSRSIADAAALDQSGWSHKISTILFSFPPKTITTENINYYFSPLRTFLVRANAVFFVSVCLFDFLKTSFFCFYASSF